MNFNFVNNVEQELDNEFNTTSKNGNQNESIHIRIQKRNGRKSITTIQGLNKQEANATYKKLVKNYVVVDQLKRMKNLE